jgi:hypothetical protein
MKILNKPSGYLVKKRNQKIGLATTGLAFQMLNSSSRTPLAKIMNVMASQITSNSVRESVQYAKGLKGESVIIKTLSALDDSYELINDIPLDNVQGNLDHLVMSSKGIFAIETKNYSGNITCIGDKWYRDTDFKTYRIKSVSRQVRENALFISRYINGATGLRVFVNPICVFVNQDMKLELNKPTITVLQLSELVPYITSMSPNKIIAINVLETIRTLMLKACNRK